MGHDGGDADGEFAQTLDVKCLHHLDRDLGSEEQGTEVSL